MSSGILTKHGLILITGGNGFIGSHVAHRLSRDGYLVRIVDIVPLHRASPAPDIEVIIGDLMDPNLCHRVLDGVHTVLHFAAVMGGMGIIHDTNDNIIYQKNHLMTLTLIDAAVKAGVTGFFFASSACVYPDTLQGSSAVDASLKESDAYGNSPPSPQGLYGLEKLHTEQLLEKCGKSLDVRIARFHNVYGVGGAWRNGREKAPAALIRKAIAASMILSGDSRSLSSPPPAIEIWGNGKQRRSFLWIGDCVDAVIRLLRSDYHHPLNIGSDSSISIEDLAKLAVRSAGLDISDVRFVTKDSGPTGVQARNSDNTLVRQQLKWEVRTTIEEGMKSTAAWMKNEIEKVLPEDENSRIQTLSSFMQSDVVDLQSEVITFGLLLPITSRGSRDPAHCLLQLTSFAESLLKTTQHDTSLISNFKYKIYVAIDHNDEFLLSKQNSPATLLRRLGCWNVETIVCHHPRGHVCALWRDCARKGWNDGCDYLVLLGDDVILEDNGWMQTIHNTFSAFSASSGLPNGFGCVAFTDTSFPGMPTFPVITRLHMEIFAGQVIPDAFINQDGDPFLFQLYRRWGASKMASCRIRNSIGGSEPARYEKVSATGWTFHILDSATETTEQWLRQKGVPRDARKLTLDIIVPCYRVDLDILDRIISLNASSTCEVMFIIIIDNPTSPTIPAVLMRYSHRADVRIRINTKNLGASESRNRGLQESAAEWVHFLDDDIIPRSDLLIEAEKSIRARPHASGFVGLSKFPTANSIFTTAVHLAQVTYFWGIAKDKGLAEDVPWGVTANLIARRNVLDSVLFDPVFPKTGGGEDIDFCLRKRKFMVSKSGGGGFCAAPEVVVTHPWWKDGKRSYWRFYMWAKGDGALIRMYPQHVYLDAAPNSAELGLTSIGLAMVGGIVWAVTGSVDLLMLGVWSALSIVAAGVVFDMYRICWRDRESVDTSLDGWRWCLAVVESPFIRMFSEWGRLVGLMERREWRQVGWRFDWFVGRAGGAPRAHERASSLQRFAIFLAFLAVARYHQFGHL